MDANEKDNSWGIKKADPNAVKTTDLDKYLGIYSTKQIPINIVITKEENTLFAEPTGQAKIPLNGTAKDTFTYEAAGVEIIFDTTKNEMTLKQAGGTYVFVKEK